MTCVVCEDRQRDVNDIQQRLAELAVDRQRCWDPIQKDGLAMEIRALEAAKREFESRQLKHWNSNGHPRS